MSVNFKVSYRKDRKKWQCLYWVDGKRMRPLFRSEKAAHNFGFDLGVTRALGSLEGESDSITIDHAANQYFKDVSKHKSKTTAINERRYFNLMFHFLIRERGLKTIDQVGYADMVALQNWLGEPRVYKGKAMQWAPATVNRCFNSIKDFFVHWVKDGKIPSSPCVHLDQLQAPDNSRRPMTSEEFQLAYSKCEEWFRPAMMFIYLTASAPTSVERLQWSDVDIDRGTITITRRKGSKGQWRRFAQPITPELLVILSSIPQIKGQVFRNESGGPLSAEWCSRIGNRAIDEAGLADEVVLYCARHALASDLTDANVNMEVIRRLMGHANIRTTQTYAKPKTESLAKALRLVRGSEVPPNCHQKTEEIAAGGRK